MRILVTGGSGFVGRRAVRHAVDAGHEVVGVARAEPAAATLRGLGARPVVGDLDDPPGLATAFAAAEADVLLNIASLGFGHIDAILAATRAAGLRRAVFVSTTGIFTALDPPSKRVRIAAERAIEASGLDWTIIRPTMIYGGPDDRNMARLLALVRRTPVLPLPGGGRLHQPVHVDDLAATLLRALDAGAAIGRAYDVAGPVPLPFRDVVAAAGTATGRRVRCLPVPVRPVLALAGGYERHARRPRLKAEQIARLAEDKAFDIAPARRDLGHRPRPFDAGLADLATATGTRGDPPAPAASRRRAATAPGRLIAQVRAVEAVAGRPVAVRFAVALVRHAPRIARTGCLDAADRALSDETLDLRPLPGVRVRVPGRLFGAAREVYCRGAFHALPGFVPAAGQVVVDLGAGEGLYTILAARAGADVIAVEARRDRADALAGHIADNGIERQVQVLHAVVHPVGRTRVGADRLSVPEILAAGGVDQVDLLRIDLGAGASALFGDLRWLRAVDRLVLRIHPAREGGGSIADSRDIGGGDHTVGGDDTGRGEGDTGGEGDGDQDAGTLAARLRALAFEVTVLDEDLRRVANPAAATTGYLYAGRRCPAPAPNATWTVPPPADASVRPGPPAPPSEQAPPSERPDRPAVPTARTAPTATRGAGRPV
ncbi:conserved hypothetical protein [Frankia canadensis]|uniref:NAD(P)-binding domain-containing protein n=1 Tax=Frankia canadensis TaxID=1836972 RepID=A0A2I2KP21_9ACTN|nr:NAD(P)H-binding protein [Frankia canadensis]SNQ47400.1 conserved hypothetical protein [Frankia canadensis]SOU54690.1 conserved hypothetical protein [Frankia canadensis]